MKKKVKLTQLGEKIIMLGVIGLIVLGALFFQAFVRIPQLENTKIILK